jgi:hypothetical protein
MPDPEERLKIDLKEIVWTGFMWLRIVFSGGLL